VLTIIQNYDKAWNGYWYDCPTFAFLDGVDRKKHEKHFMTGLPQATQ